MGCAPSHPGVAAPEVVDSTPDAGAELERLARKTSSGEFHSQHSLGRRLGAGSYGCVYAASRVAGGESVAVKVVDMHEQEDYGWKSGQLDFRRQRAVAREVAVLAALPRSPNLVAFHGLYLGDGLAYIVLERCSCGLPAALSRATVLTEASMKHVFRDMLSALARCHAAGIVHRDVKCDNFLVTPARGLADSFVVKLCDFGLACVVEDVWADVLWGVYGTPPYMAPEMLNDKQYNAKVDVWAVGVISYVLLYGRWPYMPTVLTGAAMKDAIRSGAREPAFRPKSGSRLAEISASCGKWVKALLCRDPRRRPGAEEALRQRSLHEAWTSAPLEKTLHAAARCGAFDHGRCQALNGDLDATLARLSGKPSLALSEASTCTGVGSPMQYR